MSPPLLLIDYLHYPTMHHHHTHAATHPPITLLIHQYRLSTSIRLLSSVYCHPCTAKINNPSTTAHPPLPIHHCPSTITHHNHHRPSTTTCPQPPCIFFVYFMNIRQYNLNCQQDTFAVRLS